MKFTIIVPAFNEEAYLAATLDSIQAAAAHLRARSEVDTDVIVVDNNSNDGTTAVARGKGATVVHEPAQGVARARNTGARLAEGDVLVFIDADVIVPPKLFDEIHAAMSDPNCVGGAVDVDYRPRRLSMRLYLRVAGARRASRGWPKGRRSSVDGPSSIRSEATTRGPGSARMSISIGASRG